MNTYAKYRHDFLLCGIGRKLRHHQKGPNKFLLPKEINCARIIYLYLRIINRLSASAAIKHDKTAYCWRLLKAHIYKNVITPYVCFMIVSLLRAQV